MNLLIAVLNWSGSTLPSNQRMADSDGNRCSVTSTVAT
jgi:hypothetical protein